MKIPLVRAVCPCASFSSTNRISLNPTSLFTHYLCKMAFISTLGTAVGHPNDPSAVLQVLHLSGETQFIKKKKKQKQAVNNGKLNRVQSKQYNSCVSVTCVNWAGL